MCRLLLYSSNGIVIPLSLLISDAPHSMSHQAHEDPYLPGMKLFKNIYHRNPKFNLDGYGMYYKDYPTDKILCLKSKHPIINTKTNQTNTKLRNQIKDQMITWSSIFIRNNNFKEKNPNSFQNVQPFKYKHYLFSHNGGFNTYLENYLPKIKKYLNYKYYAKNMDKINVDSRWLFSLFLSYVNTDTYTDFGESVPNFGESVPNFGESVPNFGESVPNFEVIKNQIEHFLYIMHKIKDNQFNISMNFIFTNLNNNTNIILRYRTCNQLPPALYYNKIHPLGYFVASEPLDHEPGWKLMRNQLIIIRNGVFKSYKLSPKTINCIV